MKRVQPSLQGGFSLLELLVAFAILAISLGLLYKSTGGMVRSAGDLDGRQQAAILAMGLLQSRDSVDGNGWNESGAEGAFAWQVQSHPYGDSSAEPGGVRLHELTLTVGWVLMVKLNLKGSLC